MPTLCIIDGYHGRGWCDLPAGHDGLHWPTWYGGPVAVTTPFTFTSIKRDDTEAIQAAFDAVSEKGLR